jgi:soluble lytic murein transglycosylase-like protein
VVQPGDSLFAISKRFDVPVSDLRLANKSLVASDVVKVGVSIRIPLAKAKTGLPQSIRSNPERLRLRRVIRHWAKKNSIPADLVEATLYLESGWNQSRISSTGAVGVGQLMPGTAIYIKRDLIGPQAGGLSLNEAVPEHNIRMSARYLRHLLTVTNGDVDTALHGYYQGFGSIAANGLYSDSRAYSASVKALRKRFRSDLTGV